MECCLTTQPTYHHYSPLLLFAMKVLYKNARVFACTPVVLPHYLHNVFKWIWIPKVGAIFLPSPSHILLEENNHYEFNQSKFYFWKKMLLINEFFWYVKDFFFLPLSNSHFSLISASYNSGFTRFTSIVFTVQWVTGGSERGFVQQQTNKHRIFGKIALSIGSKRKTNNHTGVRLLSAQPRSKS